MKVTSKILQAIIFFLIACWLHSFFAISGYFDWKERTMNAEGYTGETAFQAMMRITLAWFIVIFLTAIPIAAGWLIFIYINITNVFKPLPAKEFFICLTVGCFLLLFGGILRILERKSRAMYIRD